MQASIKFGLPINGIRVYYLEQLQENFVVKELVSHFHSGILQNWLKQCGFEDELTQVESWDYDLDDDELKAKLFDLFDVSPFDDVEVNLDNDKCCKEFFATFYSIVNQEVQTIVQRIISNKDYKAKLIPDIDLLMGRYFYVFKNHYFLGIINRCPLVLLMFLGNVRFWALCGLIDEDKVDVTIDNSFIDAIECKDGTSRENYGKDLVNYVETYLPNHFTKFTLKSNFSSDDDYDDDVPVSVMFKSGKYLVLGKPELVDILSADGSDSISTSDGRLCLTNGLAYSFYTDEYDDADIKVFKC